MILQKLIKRTIPMSKEEDNKAVGVHWFAEFWRSV